MTGGVWSTTFTVCAAVAVLPLASVTVHVTVVVPSGKTDGASFVTLNAQLSLACGVPNATFEAEQAVASVPTVTAGGAAMVGSVLSATVTDCVSGAVWTEASVAGHGTT